MKADAPKPLSEAESQLKAKDLALIAASLLRDGEEEIAAVRRALRLLSAAEKVIEEREAEAAEYWKTPEGQKRRAKTIARIEQYKRERSLSSNINPTSRLKQFATLRNSAKLKTAACLRKSPH